MKKNYQKPEVETVEIESGNLLAVISGPPSKGDGAKYNATEMEFDEE